MHPLLLLLLASFLLREAAASNAAQPSSCWPKSCKGLNITYPFWLEEPDRPPCGPPAFQIKCNSSGAFLSKSIYQAHRVVTIFAENRSLIVVDTNLPLDAGCPPPTFNVSIVPRPLFFSKANKKLLFLGKCGVSRPKVSAGFRSLPCDNQSFVRLGDGRDFSSNHIQGGIPPGCLFAVVPTLGGNEDDYVAGMRKGFLLKWTVVPGDCPNCMASGGECAYGHTGLAFVCNCSGSKCDRRHKHHNIKLTLVVLFSASTGLILTCLILIMYRRKHKHMGNEPKVEEILKGYGCLVPKRYKHSELKKITGSFKNKLGEGGYGMVFKGNLEDGREVAVKLLKGSKGDGEELLNEVISFRSTSHINIVNLLGFCLHGSKRALIYEYMANGSLDRHIYSQEAEMTIGWEKLQKIAIGIARGLEYLHRDCNIRIIHFDIKPHNILLDEYFCPKIADFGLAKLCNLKDSALSMAEARGTIGFIAPEVFYRGFGVVSTKSDVYSYGMMLLEMVGGRKNVKENTQSSGDAYFPNWIYNRLLKDLQRNEVTCEIEEIARQMALVGLWCIQSNPGNRPMGQVIDMLENNINEIEMPPEPFLWCPSLPSSIGS